MTETTVKPTLKIEGKYSLNGDHLFSDNLVLQLGNRYKPKKGQAKRFIGAIDPTKPKEQQFTYLSSLYSMQGLKNAYSMEYQKQSYTLRMIGVNTIEIAKQNKEPVLVFQPDNVL